MTTASVLDILIYVFDHYMMEESAEVPGRDALARSLEHVGFAAPKVERALDWLADLAGERHRPHIQAGARAMRVYADGELARLPTESRGFLFSLETHGILSPQQREIVIDRVLALDSDELSIEQLKWVVLMVLSSQPGQAEACARMEGLVFDADGSAPH
jgi:Smg protein